VRGDLIHYKLLPQAGLALAERADPPSHRRHLLAAGQGEALHARWIALPAAGRQPLLDRLQRAAHAPVSHAAQTAPPHRLDPLRVEQLRQGHPARFGPRALGLAPLRWPPRAAGSQPRGAIILETIGQHQRDPVWRSHPYHLMHATLGHLQGPCPRIKSQQPRALGGDGRPHPAARRLQALDGPLCTALALLEITYHGGPRIELPLLDVHGTEARVREGLALLSGFDEPLQDRYRSTVLLAVRLSTPGRELAGTAGTGPCG